MKEKLNIWFKISYIANVITFIISMFWLALLFMSFFGYSNAWEAALAAFALMIIFGFHFVLSIIVLIITCLLGHNNHKKLETIKAKDKLVWMTSLLGIAHAAIIIMLAVMYAVLMISSMLS